MSAPTRPSKKSTTPTRAAATTDAGAEKTQYLTFMLDRELFAIGILAIKEIIEYGNLTVVPMMPEFIRGVINLRGAVVPVVDLAARFQRKSTVVTKRTCIVIVEIETEGGRHVVGVIVDAVNEVLDIMAFEVEPAPTFGAKIRADFIYGLGKVNGRFVILLDMNHVLSVAGMSALASGDSGEEPASEAVRPGR